MSTGAHAGARARAGVLAGDATRAEGPLLLGVRHHGPGSARAVREALERYRPRAVLIEGPPEADPLVALAADEGMRPPVALLAHVVEDPARAAFWPVAEFSPEWVAIRWALAHDVPVRFIDLPAAHTLALGADDDNGPDDPATVADGAPAADAAGARLRVDPLAALAGAAGYDDPERWWEDVIEHRTPGGSADRARGGGSSVTGDRSDGVAPAVEDGDLPVRADGSGGGDGGAAAPATEGRDLPTRETRPGGGIAAVAVVGEAGHRVERRAEAVGDGHAGSGGVLAAFQALREAMGALREVYADGGHDGDPVREAHMRLRMRDARREFGDGFAVVCGAWHVPALARRTTVTADRQLLRRLPKAKVELTWVPWTHRRLSRHTGYGAGIASPGWYGHLFNAPDRPIERWMTKVAGFLRDEDHPVSSAHVIEAVRLAETLAAMRGRPLAGLAETTDAIRAVMCEGSDVPLELVRDRLVVGDVLGEVPDSAPAVPLQRDLARAQRALRLKPEAAERTLELDLRKDTDARRSRLLHRLRLLGIDWGEHTRSREGLGTFRETWRLCWEPELSVRVAEAGVWGTTVSAAATAKAESEAAAAGSLAEVTALAERCLLATLPDALPVVMRALADRAALDADVGHLAQALPALVRSVRYGDVRGTNAAALAEVAMGLAERIFVGLPPACVGLDADGAADMRRHVDAVHAAVGLLAESARQARRRATEVVLPAQQAQQSHPAPLASAERDGVRDRWAVVLRALAGRETVAAGVRGRATRLLLDDGRLEEDETARLMGRVLSPGTAPAEAAAWIEGFLGGEAGGGMLLVHDERLLGLVDAWLTGVPADAFTDVLPLLRRTFAAYEPGVRRALGELIRRGSATGGTADGLAAAAAPGFGPGLDPARADAVLPTLRRLLGIDDNEMAGVAG